MSSRGAGQRLLRGLHIYQGPHQRCWTHLLRDIHQLKERFPEHEGLAG